VVLLALHVQLIVSPAPVEPAVIIVPLDTGYHMESVCSAIPNVLHVTIQVNVLAVSVPIDYQEDIVAPQIVLHAH
jgi:hypothetical protein